MNGRKSRLFVQALAVTIFSSLSPSLMADPATYSVEKAGYVNSSEGAIEALCNPGDEYVDASCEGSYRGISLRDADNGYPMVTEPSAQGVRCKPRVLRADQIMMVIVEVTCKPGKTAKLATVY